MAARAADGAAGAAEVGGGSVHRLSDAEDGRTPRSSSAGSGDSPLTKTAAAPLEFVVLAERKVALEADFVLERIDIETKTLISHDEREIPFDLSTWPIRD
jgi:hypothetical protein